MDLSKLLNLNNKFRLRRSIFKIKLDRYIKIIEEKIFLFSVVVKKELGIVNRVENYGLLLVKKEFKVKYVGDLNVFVIVLCKNDQKLVSKDIEILLNIFMENIEKDK